MNNVVQHLAELRRRIIWTLAVLGFFFLLFFINADALFHLVVSPLLHVLKGHGALIATHVASPILTPIKLALNAALLITAPFALLQLWQFIAPGLYQTERQGMSAYIAVSLILFVLGMFFCFYIVLPVILYCFAAAVPPGVRFMPDMANALDFIFRMLLLFGLCFQVPLLCVLFVRLQILTRESLTAARPYVIVAAFFLGMLLTPPDVLSQILLAVPLCLLYEAGIFCVQFMPRLANRTMG